MNRNEAPLFLLPNLVGDHHVLGWPGSAENNKQRIAMPQACIIILYGEHLILISKAMKIGADSGSSSFNGVFFLYLWNIYEAACSLIGGWQDEAQILANGKTWYSEVSQQNIKKKIHAILTMISNKLNQMKIGWALKFNLNHRMTEAEFK